MSIPPNISAHADTAEDSASEWAVLLAASPLSAEQARKLDVWLAEDPANAAHLHRYVDIYARLDEAVPRLVDTGELAHEAVAPASGRLARVILFKKWGTGLAAAAAIALAAIWWHGRPELLGTTTAQRQTTMLTDGSRIELNARTALAVKLRQDRRFVRFETGEAFFSVAKEGGRPFVIQTSAGVVRVTGTAFNVRAGEEGDMEVTVMEGSVQVTVPAVSTETERIFSLRALDRLVVQSGTAQIIQLSSETAEDFTAWRQGWMVFQNRLLGEALQEYARYHGIAIDVTPQVAGLVLGGRFLLDARSDFFRDLAQALPVKVETLADGHLRVSHR